MKSEVRGGVKLRGGSDTEQKPVVRARPNPCEKNGLNARRRRRETSDRCRESSRGSRIYSTAHALVFETPRDARVGQRWNADAGADPVRSGPVARGSCLKKKNTAAPSEGGEGGGGCVSCQVRSTTDHRQPWRHDGALRNNTSQERRLKHPRRHHASPYGQGYDAVGRSIDRHARTER